MSQSKRAKAMGYVSLRDRERSSSGGLSPERSTSRFPNYGRRVSPGATRPDKPSQRANPSLAPGQPVSLARSKDKFVSLPDSLDEQPSSHTAVDVPTIFEDLEDHTSTVGVRGRIGVYCLAETFNRKLLECKLRARGSHFLLQMYPDVLYGKYCKIGEEPTGDIFYFDYGCVAFWGLTKQQEEDVVKNLVKQCEENSLPIVEVEVDEFQFHYTANEKPHIQNDTITINHRLSHDHLIKLSISHALSQSTKLCVFEERVLEIVQNTKDLPNTLATSGKIELSRKEIAQLIGSVFIQKSAVNLLSTVLDTPEFFWSAPDSMQNLYKRVCEYMELDDRVEVLNNRFQVLQEMLDMLRNHKDNYHTERLEWIVIWLIVIEVVVGLFECASIMGWVGKEGKAFPH